MKMKKVIFPVLGLSMLAGVTSSVFTNNVSEVKAEGGTNEILMHAHKSDLLDKLAARLGDSHTDWNSFIYNWNENPDEDEGYSYFQNFEPTGHEYTATDITEAKKSVYFDFIVMDYITNVRVSTIDDIRCILDHLFQMKEDIYEIFDFNFNKDSYQSEEIENLFENAMNLYQSVTTLLDDTYDPLDEYELTDFTAEIKAHLASEDGYYNCHQSDINNPEIIKDNMFEKISVITGSPVSDIESEYAEYLKLTNGELPLADGDPISNFYQSSESLSNLKGFVPVFYTIDAVNSLIYLSSNYAEVTEFLMSSFIIGYYSLMDLLENINSGDKAYTLELSYSLVTDVRLYIDSFEESYIDTLKTPYPVIKDIVNASTKLQAIKNSYTEQTDAAELITKLKEICNLYYSSASTIEQMDKSLSEYKFLSYEVDKLFDSYDEFLGICGAKITGYIATSVLTDYYILSAKIDSLITTGIRSSSDYIDYLQKLEQYINELDDVVEGLLDAMSDLNYEDSILLSMYCRMADFYDTAQIRALNVASEFVNEVHLDLALACKSIETTIQNIDEVYKLDDAHLRAYYEEANSVLDALNQLQIKAGQTYEDLAEDELIAEDIAVIEALYDDCSSLISDIQARQKEYTILNILERAAALLSDDDKAIEKGDITECGEMVEKNNSLIQEINDNIELLDNDPRLSECSRKLVQKNVELEDAKFATSKKLGRNTALIATGSVLGAALFFAAGFFVNRLVKQKKSKEEK